MATLLPNCKGGSRSQAAQFPPHTLPLQGLAGLQQRKLRRTKYARRLKQPTTCTSESFTVDNKRQRLHGDL